MPASFTTPPQDAAFGQSDAGERSDRTAPPSRCASRVAAALVAAFIALFATADALAAVPACVWPQAQPLSDAERCLRAALPAAAAAPAARSPQALEALLARSDAHRADDDLAAADSALACAAAQIADSAELRPHYEVVRRLGILEYGRDRPAEALASFECALRLAQDLEDSEAAARQLKNIGSSLRRIGDYAGAMRALTRSLQMQRASGDDAVGPVLNNIADVYRDLEQRDDAERFYREALAAFRARRDYVQAMHVYDSLSALALDRRDPEAATKLLETALRDLRALEDDAGAEGARRYQLMILSGLARSAIASGDLDAARRHVADGLALASAHALPPPAELQLEAARADRLGGRLAPAIARLRAALAARPEAPGMHAAMLRELSQALEQSGRGGEALAALREAYALDAADLRAQRDRGLAWSNARFNLAESRRQLAEAEAENRRRALMLWLTVASAIAALSLLSLFFLRRQQRAREAEAVRRARYEEALAHYKREADALAQDRQLIQALLDSRDEALVLLDADGQALAANRAACELLGVERDALTDRPLPERFEPTDAAALRGALEQMEDAPLARLTLSAGSERPPIRAELRQWQGGDGLIVVALGAAGDEAVPEEAPMDVEIAAQKVEVAAGGAPSVAADAVTETATATATADLDRARPLAPDDARKPAAALVESSTADAASDRDTFRRALVELMLAVVEAWERSTGLNRLELAERSRIWRINIDDGRLRARAMERYLSLSKLPQNPRWRDVLRSAYYVLGHCEKLPADTRDDLQQRVDAVLSYSRRAALA